MRVAFVIQRYGKQMDGGAEQLCRQIAERVVNSCQLEVLTTCAEDYSEWNNTLPVGETNEGGVKVGRFTVHRQRDMTRFDFLFRRLVEVQTWRSDPNAKPHRLGTYDKWWLIWGHRVWVKLFDYTPLGKVLERLWMWLQGPLSKDLSHYIEKHQSDYDAFFFFTYGYATSFYNLPRVANKSIMVPLAHAEHQIYLPLFNGYFQKPKGFVCCADEEMAFLKERFHQIADYPFEVAGIGVTPPQFYDPLQFRKNHGLDNTRFIVYCGRIDESKGCKEMFGLFMHYKMRNPSDLKLVLMGSQKMEIPEHEDIIHLGFVSQEDKYGGMAAAELLIMPSPYESLSIVLLEAWLVETPVLVNGICDVLKGQCKRSGGGMWYDDDPNDTEQKYVNFEKALTAMLVDEAMRADMALKGKAYTVQRYTWDTVEAKYLKMAKLAAGVETD